MKSLVNCGSAHYLVNQLLLLLNVPKNAGRVVVWLEGKDWRVYRKFFNPDKIIEYGKVGGEDILDGHRELKTIRPDQLSVVIKDADFKRLEGENLTLEPDVFYTDGHDVEMMMIKQASVRKDICSTFEYTDDVESFFDEIFDDLHYLSFFKWYDCHHKRYYAYGPLKKVQHDRVNLHNLTWIEDKVYRSSKATWDGSNHSGPFVRINPSDVDLFINSNHPVDRYEVTNGHDFVNRLCLHIKNKTSYARNEETMNDTLVASFKQEQFMQTNLHSSLKAWCDANVDILKTAV